MKQLLFNLLFTKSEQTVIINALYKQSFENKDMIGTEQRAIGYRCKLLADNLMNL